MHQKIYERYGITKTQEFFNYQRNEFPNEFNYDKFIQLYAKKNGYYNEIENLKEFIMKRQYQFKNF